MNGGGRFAFLQGLPAFEFQLVSASLFELLKQNNSGSILNDNFLLESVCHCCRSVAHINFFVLLTHFHQNERPYREPCV